jgi:glutathione S-transferase
MERFEAHLDVHDYLLGGRPSLADFSLMGPLYGAERAATTVSEPASLCFAFPEPVLVKRSHFI